MADKGPKQLTDEIAPFAPSEIGLGMYLVPGSHRAALNDADLACTHIAKGLGGWGGVKAVRYFQAHDQKLAVCQACAQAIAAKKATAATVH